MISDMNCKWKFHSEVYLYNYDKKLYYSHAYTVFRFHISVGRCTYTIYWKSDTKHPLGPQCKNVFSKIIIIIILQHL